MFTNTFQADKLLVVTSPLAGVHDEVEGVRPPRGATVRSVSDRSHTSCAPDSIMSPVWRAKLCRWKPETWYIELQVRVCACTPAV